MLRVSFQKQNLRKWPCYFSFIFRYKMLFSLTVHNVKCIVIFEAEILSAFASIPLSIGILWTNSEQISYINKCGIRSTHNIGLSFIYNFMPSGCRPFRASLRWERIVVFSPLGRIHSPPQVLSASSSLVPGSHGRGHMHTAQTGLELAVYCAFPLAEKHFLLWSRWTFTHKTC